MNALEARQAVQRLLAVEPDGDLGRKSWKAFQRLQNKQAIIAVQELLGLKGSALDGVAGRTTTALLSQLDDMPDAAQWPAQKASVAPEPQIFPSAGDGPLASPLGREAREKTFGGPFRWRRKPEPGNAENIVIAGDWEEENIVSVEVPQLRKVPGNFSRMRWNKRGVKQLLALWEAWEKAGLLGLVLSYEGAFVPRLIRGSTTSLSNHAYGSAFDINYFWNQLGKPPAKRGARGSVRELVPLAHKHGFYWGGNFSRLDGMHLEICKILP